MADRMRSRRVAFAAGFLGVLAAVPAVTDGAPAVLEGSDWSLAGRSTISGVARAGRRSRPFRDAARSTLALSFPDATTFGATDQDGFPYAGTYARRGTSGTSYRFTFDAHSETVLDGRVEAWLASFADEQVDVTTTRTAYRATVSRTRMTIALSRSFTASSASARARGTYVVRESGRRVP